jgi:hypothetical protein
MRAGISLLCLTLLAGCVPPEAGCVTYGLQRPTIPDPLPNDPSGRWIAITDTAMTATCRG